MMLKLESFNMYTDGGWVIFKCDSRLSAAHLRLKVPNRYSHGWRGIRFQNGALASAPRTFVLKVRNGYTDGGRLLLQMGLWIETPSKLMLRPCERPTAARVEGGSFSKMGLPLENHWTS